MGNLLERLWRMLSLHAAKRYEDMEERWGRSAVTGIMMLEGAFVGVYAVWLSYGLILLWWWLHTRPHDDLLVLLFLIAWFLIGAVQGAWLGGAIGFARAMQRWKKAGAAGLACLVNGFLFLLLILTLLDRFIPSGERWFFLSRLSALPTLTAILMLLWGLALLFEA